MDARRFQLKKPAGFTLLELVLVMVILCTVLAMAAPSLRGFFSSRQMQHIAEQIQMLIRYARMEAVSEARYYRVEFDINRREYGITVLSDTYYLPLETSFGMRYPLPSDVELEFEDVELIDGKYVLQFDLQGNAKPCRIRLYDSKNNRIDLICLSPVENFELVVLNAKDV